MAHTDDFPRRETLHAPGGPRRDKPPFRRPGGDRPRPTPKGHDAILADWQTRGATVNIRFLSGENISNVKIVARDKFTISIKADTDTYGELIYKHALESIKEVPPLT